MLVHHRTYTPDIYTDNTSNLEIIQVTTCHFARGNTKDIPASYTQGGMMLANIFSKGFEYYPGPVCVEFSVHKIRKNTLTVKFN